MTWRIKIAEFLVEMELFPHFPKSNEGGKPLKISMLILWLLMTKTNTKTQAGPYQETHDGWSGGVVAVSNLTLRKLNFKCCSRQLTFSYITCLHY